MRIDPYETAIAAMHRPDKIRKAIATIGVHDPLPTLSSTSGKDVTDALMVTPKEAFEGIGVFTQCLKAEQGRKTSWVMDARPYMKYNHRDDSYRLTAENDFGFQVSRLALTQVAEKEGGMPFIRLGDIPVKTFVRWITLAISQRFVLPPEDQMRISVIVAYYYHTQLSDNLALSETEKARLANMVARVTSVNTPQVLEISDELGALATGPDLAKALSDHSGSIRLKNLKYTDLYLLLSSSWIGVHSRETVGVAIEHIPTFIAMLFAALGDRSYRKTLLTRRAETTGRQQDFKQFVDQTYRLISQQFS